MAARCAARGLGPPAGPDPARLADRARELRTELPSAGLAEERVAFLAGQLRGLEVSGRKLAGTEIGYVDEVAAYFQVRPSRGDPERYADAHAALDRLLPGAGSLAERYPAYRQADEVAAYFQVRPSRGDPERYADAHAALDRLLPGAGSLAERYPAYRTADEVPPERLRDCVLAISSALRDIVRREVGLPARETVEYEVVTDKPWSGFNYYRGNYASLVAINADLPNRLSGLPALVAHETYPGHHTEHCRKDQRLVATGGRLEHTIFLVNTPECLMAEGLADLGVPAALGPGWGRWAQEIYADLGLSFDGELAEAVAEAVLPLDGVRQDAALMLHDYGWGEDEVVTYLQRWALVPADRARRCR